MRTIIRRKIYLLLQIENKAMKQDHSTNPSTMDSISKDLSPNQSWLFNTDIFSSKYPKARTKDTKHFRPQRNHNRFPSNICFYKRKSRYRFARYRHKRTTHRIKPNLTKMQQMIKIDTGCSFFINITKHGFPSITDILI